MLPKIEHELYLLSVHLEEDEPQTPDTIRSLDEVPQRLEPLKTALLNNSELSHESITPQEMARYLNEAEAERDSLDPPPSHLDLALEGVVARNALAKRDVQTQLRSWRRQLTIRPPSIFSSLSTSLLAGGILGIFGLATSPEGIPTGIHFLWRVSIVIISLQVALLSASGFARERAGNMMVQLQLSALSPTEILGAKITSPLVLGARFWGFPVLALTLASLGYGLLRVSAEIILFFAFVILTSLIGTLCSLQFKSIPLAISAVLFAQVISLFVLPALFSPLLFTPPHFLRVWWLEP
ncbi:MAG: ABC transporter permease, partial [Cytophagaceae bacterium]